MARGNIREYLRGETVWRKKYFYVLRPLLAMRWIDQELGPVPIEFQKLVDATVHDAGLRAAIDDLIDAKRAGAELNRGPRMPAISDFIETEMARLELTASGRISAEQPIETLNQLFRDTLQEVWHDKPGRFESGRNETR
jgi:predicted nucleotidyltransferase